MYVTHIKKISIFELLIGINFQSIPMIDQFRSDRNVDQIEIEFSIDRIFELIGTSPTL